MRITLTIDDDVARTLEQIRASRAVSTSDLINEALRRGLKDMATRPKRLTPFRTNSVDLGRVLVGSIDGVAQAIILAEGEAFK
jgi:hypothetical protein